MFVRLTPTGRNLSGLWTTTYALEVTPESIACVRSFVKLLEDTDSHEKLEAALKEIHARLSSPGPGI